MTRVLLLEDDFSISFNIMTLLNEHGLDVDVRNSSAAAIECLKTETYDLVIVDIIILRDNRPVPDGGVILISWLRSLTQKDLTLRSIPILCISGATRQPGMSHLLDMAQNLGADDALAKPFNDIELIAAVDRLIAGKSPKDTDWKLEQK